MKTSVVAFCLVFAFTVALYGAEDRKPDTAPEGAFPKKLSGSGVDNFYQLSDSLYSGSKPDGEEGFRFLSKLGVKTILSVDGVAPEVALAKKYGIGYVHVPLSSDGIKEAQASQIVKAAAEQPGPLFIHCHYGMNRGPSAAAIVCIAQHGWTPEQATAWMQRAGTSANCTGLFRDVRNFKAHSSVPLAKDTGTNRVQIRRAGKANVEIQVSSDRPFRVVNAGVVLYIGQQKTYISRHPQGKLNTLIFTIPADDFARTKDGDAIAVRYEPDSQGHWDFGVLNKKDVTE